MPYSTQSNSAASSAHERVRAGSALLSQKQTLLGCRRKPRQPLRSVFVHEQPSARPKVCCILEQSHLCRREAIARGLVRHRIDDADQRLALWNVVKNFRWLRQPFGTVCRHQVLDFAPGTGWTLARNRESDLTWDSNSPARPSLASPQNPSGVAIPEATLREVLRLVEEICPEAYLLVDETYREAAYGDDPIADNAVALGPKVISVASLSKCHGAPGLRLGWAITRDPGLRQQLTTGKFNTVISCSAVDEALALKVFERRVSIIAERRVHLDAGLQRTAAWVRANNDFVNWVRPDAGALCCVRLRPAVFDDASVDRFYQALATKGTRVANGTWFGEEARVFRLGFGLLPMAELGDALAALAAALREAAQPGRSL
jgi:hypothetical protein